MVSVAVVSDAAIAGCGFVLVIDSVVSVCVPSLAFVADSSAMLTVSVDSNVSLPGTVTVNVLLVCPGAKVTVPAPGAKSSASAVSGVARQ